MKILFIGGTGTISSACTALALEKGYDLYLFNRGETSKRGPLPYGTRHIKGDIRDIESVKHTLGQIKFDAVVNWVAFLPGHVEQDIEFFKERAKQYIFISSASTYQKPPASLPVTESTILDNPYW